MEARRVSILASLTPVAVLHCLPLDSLVLLFFRRPALDPRPAGGSVINSARRAPDHRPLGVWIVVVLLGNQPSTPWCVDRMLLLFFSATGSRPTGVLIECHCCSSRLLVLDPLVCGSLLSFAHVRHLITDSMEPSPIIYSPTPPIKALT